MTHHWLRDPKVIICMPLLAAFLFIIACGSPAEPVVVEKEVIKEVIKEVPVEKIVVATPTAGPAGMGVAEGVEKFTIMMTSFGNGIFNNRYATGENNLWQRLSQVWLVGGDYTPTGGLVLSTDTGASKAWEVVDGGNAVVFTIRDDIKFHNGQKLTAEDVLFSQQWGLSESSGVSAVRMFRNIASMELTGPDTYKVSYKDPMGFFPTAMSETDNPSTGIILSKDYWMSQKLGAEIEGCTGPVDICRRAEGFEANPGPATAGAYELVAHLHQEEQLYERFDDYFAKDKRPYPFKTISLRDVPELATRVAALRAQAADLIEADLTVVDQMESGGGQVIFAPESVHIWITNNGCDRQTDNDGNPIMCYDQKVRYALDFAIDKELIQVLYGGPESFQIAGLHGIGSPSGLGYEPDLAPFPFDPDKARQLLADAGYPNGQGFNGGRSFPIHTWSGAGAPLTVEVSTLICDMWAKELNIKCEVKVGDEGTIKKTSYAGEIAGQYLVRTNENTIDGGRRMFGRYAKEGAYIAYDLDIAPKVIAAAAVVGTQEERHAAYYEALKTIYDKHYDFTPGFLNLPYGLSARVASWEPWPLAPYPSALWTVKFK